MTVYGVISNETFKHIDKKILQVIVSVLPADLSVPSLNWLNWLTHCGTILWNFLPVNMKNVTLLLELKVIIIKWISFNTNMQYCCNFISHIY